MKKKFMRSVYRFVFYLASVNFLISCGKSSEKLVIFTAVNEIKDSVNLVTGESWRYIPDASIYSVDLSKPGKSPVLLTKDFISARSPEVSWDGTKMVFAGKQRNADNWKIWEMNLSTKKYRQVSGFEDNCTDPAYLPIDRIVFTRSMKNDTTGISHNLYTCNTDGSDVNRITFHPHADFAPAVLADGRIMEISRQVYPSDSGSLLYVLRPDGTKADIFCELPVTGEIMTRVCEAGNTIIYYIKSENGKLQSGELFSLNQNRPLYSEKKIVPQTGGNFCYVTNGFDGNLIVSFRPEGESEFGLYELDPVTSGNVKQLYAEKGKNIIEAVVAAEHPRQRKLPSEVDMLVKTGQMMCQDINILGPATSGNKKRSEMIEILGIGKSLGKVAVESDGSFYIKSIADMPFRIQTIDGNGKVLNGPSGWMWLRPNERRGCVGCHEDPELVPANRLPLAVKNSPVSIPVHITKIKEKSVELE